MIESHELRYAAYAYLDEWIQTDKPCRGELLTALRRDDANAGGKALARFAVAYGVSRTLKVSTEEDRLSTAFKGLPKELDRNTVAAVLRYAKLLNDEYKRRADSAASKFMWLLFPDSVVIYDSYAWEWIRLERPHSEHHSEKMDIYYPRFCSDWEKEFSSHSEQISQVCQELVGFRSFTLLSRESDSEMKKLLDSRWFQRRVFDRAIQRAGEVLKLRETS